MIVVAAVVPQFNLDPRDDAVRRKTQRSIGRRFQHLDEASRPLAANAVSAGDGHRCNRLMRPVSSVSADGVFIFISTPWRGGPGDHAASKDDLRARAAQRERNRQLGGSLANTMCEEVPDFVL